MYINLKIYNHAMLQYYVDIEVPYSSVVKSRWLCYFQESRSSV